jgi:PhnB protein
MVEPYLFFDGRCEEALNFYRAALGAEIEAMMRFSDGPQPPPPGTLPPGSENKIMHARFRVGGSAILASDGRCMGQPEFKGTALALTLKSDEEVERTFQALATGGQVQMPLAKTFFTSRFGMVADRFGVSWMLLTEHQPPQQ